MIFNYIKIFIYHLKQNKLFSFLNVLGLSIGISGVIFAILYWNNEHAYDAWNPEKEKVYMVLNKISDTGNIWPSNSIPFGKTCKATIPEIEAICFMDNYYISGVLKYKNQKFILQKAILSDNGFFEMFPFPIVKGATNNILKDAKSVAISEVAAHLIFKNEDPIGKMINFENEFYTVKAVFKVIEPSSIQPDYVFNGVLREGDENSWGNFNYGLFIKIKKGAVADDVLKKMQNVNFVNRTLKDAKESGKSVSEFIKEFGETTVILDQLKTARLYGTVTSLGSNFPEGTGNLQLLYILMGLSVLILVLTIVNYINLATAYAIKRAKEIGIRKIVGANQTQIISQLLIETAIIVCFSIFCALAVVELSLPYFNDFLNKKLTMNGTEFYMQIILIFGIVIILAGLFPAIYISNFETLKVLKGNFSRSKSGIWLRNAMLVLQYAIATFFIIGALIVNEQVNYMINKDLGFKGNQVLKITFNPPNYNKKLQTYNTTKQEILKFSGVDAVSTFAGSFGHDTNSTSGFSHNGVFVQGHNVDMDYGFLDMMKIKIIEGRDLSPKYATDTISNILINETCVKILGLKNPVNTIINRNDQDLKIVGVVKDFNITGFDSKIPPMVFINIRTLKWNNFNYVYVKVKAENVNETLSKLENYWKKNVNQDYDFEFDFVDKSFAKTYFEQVKQKDLFFILNLIVIIIAVFGLFALASFAMERRLKEIAIRKTLGAETNVLIKALSKQYVIFCLMGFIIGLFPAYLLLKKWLENFAYRIDIPVFPFIIALIVLLLLTLSIVLTKAYQVSKIDVLKYLKYE